MDKRRLLPQIGGCVGFPQRLIQDAWQTPGRVTLCDSICRRASEYRGDGMLENDHVPCATYLTRDGQSTFTIYMHWVRYFKGVALWAGLGAPFYIGQMCMPNMQPAVCHFGSSVESLSLNGEDFKHQVDLWPTCASWPRGLGGIG